MSVGPGATIFLDIDGVMRPLEEDRADATEFWLESAVSILKFLVKTLDAQIVLSTSWRGTSEQEIREKLLKCGLPSHVGCTPVLGTTREDEVLAYVKQCNLVKWVAVDDAPLDLPPLHFHHIDPSLGITADDAPEIVDKLTPPSKYCCVMS
eukprot:TRINITY_DN249_c4_g1_i1.p1 TRINITY_DN249_c4_g1~~TRINITY_DN249_c4_g1_i1.p1  ORF type:complete len:151 (+),score=14.09 TRINITY_DN249_c4_g1_i1:32-484(+)